MPAVISATHIGSFFYELETSYSGGFTAIQQHIPSAAVTSSPITPAMNPRHLPTINDYDYQGTILGAHDYTVNVEHFLQNTDATHTLAVSLENLAVARTLGDMTSICACLKTNATTFFVLKGGKINTQTITFAVGQPITVATEIWFNNLTTAGTVPTGTTPAAMTGNFDSFNGAMFTRAAKWIAGIKGATVTINNHLERIPRINTGAAQAGDYSLIMPGIQETTMTADIIADLGGITDINDILTDPHTSTILQSRTGDALGYKWTLTNPYLNSEPVPYSADMTTMIISASLGAESVALAATT